MPLSNYDKQKRWREKNRARYNLQQRNRRKNLSGGLNQGHEVPVKQASAELEMPALPAQTPKDETLAHLRSLIKQEQEKPATEPSATPTTPVGGIYRNDQGGVISKFAWEKLQKLKEQAKEGGYTLDEYSQ